ncbi:TPA: ead/Ea22-like family protein [Escherichia coli]|uniref:ead/Ea22-like family protein n=1 Tax=Escherichia coli TaxID=562 RepID=UPI000FC32AF8|nr:ead/Ea22-like family protein [Escherichia coli]EED1319213.1 ead/Ea22-like family protein [Escherichia coli]EFJ4044976.1 ead/Ea22-like family protein [Escherichia coli]EHC2248437.1 ead/Ea22-like family protein [Escherichia coli]HAW1021614.1 ead/Ea22-like family protein [Escherichia coli]
MTTEIDYQVLRDVSERAITAMTHLSILPGDDDLLSEKKLKELGIDIDAIHAFKIMAGPETMLSLLDERDALNERIAELEANLAELAEDQQKAIESIKQADAAVKLAHEKFSALAAENVLARKAVQAFCDVVGDNTEVICEEVGRDGVLVILEAMKATGNMPATDAFLAEYHHVPSKYNGWRLVPDKLTEQMKYRIVPLLATIKPHSVDEYDRSGENAQFLDWVWAQLMEAAKFAYEGSVNG